MNLRYQFLVVFVLFSAIINLFAADVCEYSKQDLMREQRSMEYSAQEWREIAGLLMGMDFQHSEKDVAYMKELPLYQNQLLQSFLHRWRKTRQHKADYIKLLSGGEWEPEPSALKKNLSGEAGGALYKRDRISSVPERSCGSGGCA